MEKFWGLLPHEWNALSTVATFLAVFIALGTSTTPLVIQWIHAKRRDVHLRTRLVQAINLCRGNTIGMIEEAKQLRSPTVAVTELLHENASALYAFTPELDRLNGKRRKTVVAAIAALKAFDGPLTIALEFCEIVDQLLKEAYEANKKGTDINENWDAEEWVRSFYSKTSGIHTIRLGGAHANDDSSTDSDSK